MPLMTFERCWRGRDDCVSFSAVEGIPPGTTEQQFEALAFEPVSFVCCGCIREGARQLPQDAYRVCFKNGVSDEMTDNDEQDLAHLVHVIVQAQAVIATRRVHRPAIQVLGDEGWIEVPSKQFEAMSTDEN